MAQGIRGQRSRVQLPACLVTAASLSSAPSCAARQAASVLSQASKSDFPMSASMLADRASSSAFAADVRRGAAGRQAERLVCEGTAGGGGRGCPRAHSSTPPGAPPPRTCGAAPQRPLTSRSGSVPWTPRHNNSQKARKEATKWRGVQGGGRGEHHCRLVSCGWPDAKHLERCTGGGSAPSRLLVASTSSWHICSSVVVELSCAR